MSRSTDLFSTPIDYDTVNEDGYPAFEATAERRYLQLLMCNTLTAQFYATEGRLLTESIRWHRMAAVADPEFMAKALVYARQKGYMRLQPVLGLAILSELDDKSWFRAAFRKVILIPSDLQDLFVILESLGRGHGGRSIKDEVASWLQGLTPYWTLKYNGRGRGYNLADIVRLTHPIPSTPELSTLFRYLARGDVPLEELPDQLRYFEMAKRAATPNDQAQAIARGRLPHEVVTGTFNMDPTLWSVLVPNLPLGALLRFLRTLERHQVLDEHRGPITERLMNPSAIKAAKLHPVALYKAWSAVSAPWLKAALEGAISESVKSLPRIPGRTAILLDTSGSMAGVQALAALVALTLHEQSADAVLIEFGNTARARDVSEEIGSKGLLGAASGFEAMGYTDLGAPIRMLHQLQPAADHVVVVTDEQQNAGPRFVEEMKILRAATETPVRSVVVDVQAARGAIAPPDDPLTWWVYGWSDIVPAHVWSILTQNLDQSGEVRAVQLDLAEEEEA